jgi:hypothetical protein
MELAIKEKNNAPHVNQAGVEPDAISKKKTQETRGKKQNIGKDDIVSQVLDSE